MAMPGHLMPSPCIHNCLSRSESSKRSTIFHNLYLSATYCLIGKGIGTASQGFGTVSANALQQPPSRANVSNTLSTILAATAYGRRQVTCWSPRIGRKAWPKRDVNVRTLGVARERVLDFVSR